MTQIVTVNVSQTIAEAPNTLQRTGALLSQGATTTAPGTLSLLTQLADLTPLLEPARTITSITWSANVATVTTAAAHGYTNADTLSLTIAGATPTGYNGTFVCTIAGANTFTYPLLSNPGGSASAGTYVVADVAELTAMATTFFAQGTSVPVYVLELGPGNATDGATYLGTWITANPGVIYSYLVPKSWDNNSTFLTLLASFENPTSKTYFFVTTTTGTYSNYTALMKCVFALIQAPAAPATEFTCAAAFWRTLSYNPSTTNQVAPTAFAFVFGVTPYPTKGNAALLATLKAAFINIVQIASEGGISDTILTYGTTKDGRDFTYWYSVDWVQINIDLDLSNEIINGSNNPQAPLYYDQNGINRLQARAQQTMTNGVAYGLVLPPVKVTAVPFPQYVLQNPSDYPEGVYNGLAVTYTPQRGFTAITFNVQVTDFPAG